MDMLDILRKYIRAELTGNWELQLQAIKEMLPYLAAPGHNPYVKYARLFMQRMTNLKTQHPSVQKRFEEVFHVARRSDCLWAGLASDLIIEQVLMKSLKISGGSQEGEE